MDEVQNVTMQTPIEIALQIDEDGMTTARNLYEFLELGIGQFLRWAKTNIENNEFYEEGKDWWGFDIVSSGNKCKDYRLSTDFAKHLCMESHSQKGKIARKYFVDVEDKAKQLVINRAQLSPQMQMFYSIADGQAKLELEQKRQAEQLARAEEKANKALENVEAIKESVRPVSEHWREDVNNKFNKIQRFAGITYNNLRGDMYEELEKELDVA